MFGYIRNMDTLVIITGLKHLRLWFGPNELLLLVGRVVIFGIKARHQSKMRGESRLSQGLKDNVTSYVMV